MKGYRDTNLEFNQKKSKVLRKEKEPTYFSGQIYYIITLNINSYLYIHKISSDNLLLSVFLFLFVCLFRLHFTAAICFYDSDI